VSSGPPTPPPAPAASKDSPSPAPAPKVPPAPPPVPDADSLDGLRALAASANDSIAVLQRAVHELERQLAEVQKARAVVSAAPHEPPQPVAPPPIVLSKPVAPPIVPSKPVALPRVPAAAPEGTMQLSTSDFDLALGGSKQRQRLAVAVTLCVFAGIGGLLTALIRSCG